MKRLGLDIGGTYIKWALVETDNRISKYGKFPTFTGEKHAEAMIKNIIEFVNDNKEFDFRAIGISSTGVFSDEGKVVFSSSIPGYQGIHITKIIEDSTDIPARVDNDVNCAALAEAEEDISMTIALGTGIGSGIVINGKVFKGSKGYAGEIGHTVIHDGKSYEDLASAKALMKALNQIRPELILGEQIAEYKDDDEVMRIADEWLGYVALGVKNAILTIDPKEIVIGGGIINSYAFDIDKLEEKVKSILPKVIDINGLLKVATNGNKASSLGAAKLW